MHGVPDQVRSLLQVQLPLDVLAVGFDGLDTQLQRFGDLPRTAARTDQAQHLQLAVTQALDGSALDLDNRKPSARAMSQSWLCC